MINNEKGITLVELAATLAIMSMIIILISSVHIFGQKQFSQQSTQLDHQSNVRLAISTVTKDIRGTTIDAVSTDGNVLTIGENQYKVIDNELLKNEAIVALGIESFFVEKNENKINVSITSLPDKQGKKNSLSTVIYIRE